MQEENMEEYETSTMGEILRNARQKQKKDLREVADELCIRRFYLEAIENMDFDNIPPAPYGTGFIKSYAKYLGLNSERIMLSYRKSLGEVEVSEQPELHIQPTTPNFKHIILGICGLVVLGGIWAWFSLAKEAEIAQEESFESNISVPEPVIIEENSNLENAPVVQEQPENVAPEVKQQPATQEPAEEAKSQAEKPVAEVQTSDADVPQVSPIRMILVGPTWVELRQDGKILISNVYKKGFTYDIPTEGNITVSVGRYYNAEFWRDGQKIKVVTAMNKKNVSLNKFMNKQN